MTTSSWSGLILFVSAVVPNVVLADAVIALNDPKPEVRRAAVAQLQNAPPAQAIPALCMALGDRDKTIVFAAYDALRDHATTSPAVLLREVNHPMESVRFGLLRVILALPAQSIDALELQAMLHDPAERIRLEAVRAIARHHQQQPVLRQALEQASLDSSAEVKRAALDTLDRFDD